MTVEIISWSIYTSQTRYRLRYAARCPWLYTTNWFFGNAPWISKSMCSLPSSSKWLSAPFLSFFLAFFRYWFAHTWALHQGVRMWKFWYNKKQKQHKKTTKQHKNFWLNFCLNKECPKLLCGLGICHRRRQTIPMWNSSGEKGILQGITVCLVSAVLSTMWWPGSFQTVSRGHILVFFNIDTAPQWILWKRSMEDWSLWASRDGHSISSR